MDRAKELLSDLRDHWDDSYWWHDHPALRITLLSIIAGVIGLLFKWLETKIQLAARVAAQEGT
jgi:hypothetical protein